MEKWEYLFANFGFEEDTWRLVSSSDIEQFEKPTVGMYEIVNELGDKGWELVTHTILHDMAPKTEDGVTTIIGIIRMVFKRPKQPTPGNVTYSSQRIY